MPVPGSGEDAADRSEAAQLFGSFFREEVFHVSYIAFQGFHTEGDTCGEGFKESIFFFYHREQTVCDETGGYTHQVGGVYTHT